MWQKLLSNFKRLVNPPYDPDPTLEVRMNRLFELVDEIITFPEEKHVQHVLFNILLIINDFEGHPYGRVFKHLTSNGQPLAEPTTRDDVITAIKEVEKYYATSRKRHLWMLDEMERRLIWKRDLERRTATEEYLEKQYGPKQVSSMQALYNRLEQW